MSAKQAEAQQVLGQLQQLDSAAQVASSRYQQATAQLQLLQQKLSVNKQALGVARGNLATAQKALAQRLVAIYTSQDSESSSLAVILGAQSLNDLVNRLETENAVTTQNSSLVTAGHLVRALDRPPPAAPAQRATHRRPPRCRARRREERDRFEARRGAASLQLRPRRDSQLQAEQRASQLAAEQHARVAATAQQLDSSLGGSGGISGGNIPGDRYGAAVGIAEQYLGVPYVWGGASPSGFDCSGLVMYVYAQLGVSLAHYTVAQYNYPNAVHPSRSELEPGDLVFFAGLGHVGIYIGNNEFIHAPHTGAVVSIDSLTGWYSSEYAGATRILG